MVKESTMSGQPGTFDVSAGCLCLDFVNTLENRLYPVSRELLQSYQHLMAWGQQTNSINTEQTEQLLVQAEQYPQAADAVLQRAISMREAMYRVFTALAQSASPAASDIALLNNELAQTLSQSRLVQDTTHFAWDWTFSPHALDYVLWPTVRSAADLLTSPDLHMLRVCAAEDCSWLFLDSSKNQTRRWCNMKSCGNRAKARRHLARKSAPSL
ncbi:MAG TPA: ABATE domain-containing protein [Ktedonobacteraceae bacterium]|nr:ABATE domain-containing protein [Ktedonobacteraceae bacterium]